MNPNPNNRKTNTLPFIEMPFEQIKKDFFRKKICDMLMVDEKSSDEVLFQYISRGVNCIREIKNIQYKLKELKE